MFGLFRSKQVERLLAELRIVTNRNEHLEQQLRLVRSQLAAIATRAQKANLSVVRETKASNCD